MANRIPTVNDLRVRSFLPFFRLLAQKMFKPLGQTLLYL